MINRIFAHPITITSITILAILFCYTLIFSKSNADNLRSDVELARQEVADLRTKIDELYSNLESNQDPYVLERRVRDELLMKQPNETVVYIPRLDTESSAETNNTPAQLEPLEAWWQLLRS